MTARCRLSREIQSECAFTYMNAVSGKNLTGAFSSMRIERGHRVRHRRRTRRCQGRSAVPPDDSDMHLGRERPPKTGPGTVIGGWQRGSLTPQMPPSLLPTAAPTATRAANSAARLTAVKLLIAKNIATSPTDAITFRSRLVDQRTAHEQGGPLLPSLCSPLLFFAFGILTASRGGERASKARNGPFLAAAAWR